VGEEGASADVFTRFVAAWDPPQEPLEPLVAEAWQAFSRLVQRELRRRSLTQAPPQWLGIYGFASWWDGAERGGPLDDLAAEAFRFVFVERFAALKGQTLRKANIEGLVASSVRNFFHDRQRSHDPLGARLFDIVGEAARSAIDSGKLEVVAGPLRISTSTVLAGARQANGGTVVAQADDLLGIVQRWNDELLPALVTATHGERSRLVADLASRLGNLRSLGVSAFRLADLLTGLRQDVRQRWAALLDETRPERDPADEPGDAPIRQDRPLEPWFAEELLADDALRKLFDCVAATVGGEPHDPRTRDYLGRLLRFVRAFASDDAPSLTEQVGRLPSERRLGAHLRIPRERIGGLLLILRSYFVRCRSRLTGRARGHRRQRERAEEAR
jgi:hypothetical protein